MRAALLLIGLVACDLQPPPRRAPPRAPADAGAAAATATDAAATAAADASGAPSTGSLPTGSQPAGSPPVDAGVASDICVEVGGRVAAMLIATSTEPTEKAFLEQDRSNLVRRLADSCTNDHWDEATRACFASARARADLSECSRRLAPAAGGVAPFTR